MSDRTTALDIQRQTTIRQNITRADPTWAWLKEIPRAKPVPVVLVAEDDPDMRAMLVAVLRKSGYRVQECKDGWDLLQGLKHYIMPEYVGEHYDLIISDIRMPGVTGLEIMEIADVQSGFPPVILITAFGDEQTHTAAALLGAAALFDKPFDIDALLKRVNEIIPPLP